MGLYAPSIPNDDIHQFFQDIHFFDDRFTRDLPGDLLIAPRQGLDLLTLLIGKAGRVRHMGWRPHVRGVAMNPIDHPHGGGEGRTSGGRTPVTPWGKDTKGTRTRKNKATDKYIIRTRHVKKAR